MSFSDDVDKFCKKEAPEYIDRVVRSVVIEIGRRLITHSPVGDIRNWQPQSLPAPAGYTGGHFRGNWQYNFGSPIQNEIDRIDPSGRDTWAAIKGSVSNQFGVHWISNNTPYAERIEQGWSNQAPQGLVGLIELEFPQIFREASQ